MSYDVQMFVSCDHIAKVPGLPNPTILPTITTFLDVTSKLQPGTYYAGYTWSDSNGETVTSGFSKIYLNAGESIKIIAKTYTGNDDPKLLVNFYIGYSAERLIGSLTEVQAAVEILILKENVFKQGDSQNDNFVFTGPFVRGKLKPINNSTVFKSFIGEEGMCPRCYGKGYYFDIFFDITGQVIKSTDSVKLLQEMLKAIIEDKGSNKFHPNWGCDVNQRIGTKKRGIADKFKVEMSIKSAIEYLQTVQKNNQLLRKNANPEEIIESIKSIRVEEDGATGYNVFVEVLSGAGEVIAYNVNV